MRPCTKCGTPYPPTKDFFYAGKSRKDGLSSQCKGCLAERGRNQRELISENRRKRKVTDPHKMRGQQLAQAMRQRASKAGVPFDATYITPKYIEGCLRATPNCPCCRTPLLQEYAFTRTVAKNSPSFDRIIPALGYVRGNVALLCHRCNTLKSDMTINDLERLLDWLRRAQSVAAGLYEVGCRQESC